MILLALALASRTIASIKNLAISLIKGLANNPAFPNPPTTGEMIQAAIDAVGVAEGDLTTAKQVVVAKSNELDNKVQALKNVINNVGLECLDKVKNDPEDVARTKLLSVNLILKGDTTAPTQEVALPTNFHVTTGDHNGQVNGGCNKVQHAVLYRVRMATTPIGPWVVKYEGTRTSFTIKDLPQGLAYFQISAFGTHGGWTEWSDLASCFVV